MREQARYCRECGTAMSAAAGFCRKCGSEQAPGDSDVFEWDYTYPLLTNRFFLYDMVKLLFWTFLLFDGLLLTIFLIQGEPEAIVPFLGISGLVLVGFAIAIAAISLVFFGNRHTMRFHLSPRGARYDSGTPGTRTVNRIGLLLGIATLNPRIAGASLLAESRASGGLSWDEIHRVKEYPGLRVITLMDSWHVVLRLYCSPENYGRIAELVRGYAAAGAQKRQQAEAKAASVPSTVRPRALLSLCALAAAAAALFSPFELGSAPVFLAFLLLALVTLWLPGASRVTGGILAAGALGAAALIVREGTRTRSWIPQSVLKGAPMPEWAQYSDFSRMQSGEWLALGLAGAGLLFLAGLGLAALAGKLHRPASARNSRETQWQS